MKSCKECGANLLDINEDPYIYECEECGNWFTEAEEDIEGDFSTKVFAGIISAGFKAEAERDELKAKIKAFFEAWFVKPDSDEPGDTTMLSVRLPVPEGTDDATNWMAFERGYNPRADTLWALWDAVNSKSG